jgi:hypothetical protein
MVTGIVSTINNGLTMAFNKARTRLTMIIVFASFSKWTPGKK